MSIEDSLEHGRTPQRRRAPYLEQVNTFWDGLAAARQQWEMAGDHYSTVLDMRDSLKKPGGLLNPIDLEPDPPAAPVPPGRKRARCVLADSDYEDELPRELPRARPPAGHQQVQELE